MIACVLDANDECDEDLSLSQTLSGSRTIGSFALIVPSGSYALIALKDVNDSGSQDAGDLLGGLVDDDGQYRAMLLHSLIGADLPHWQRIDTAVRMFVGESDSMVVPEVAKLMADLGGPQTAETASADQGCKPSSQAAMETADRQPFDGERRHGEAAAAQSQLSAVRPALLRRLARVQRGGLRSHLEAHDAEPARRRVRRLRQQSGVEPRASRVGERAGAARCAGAHARLDRCARHRLLEGQLLQRLAERAARTLAAHGRQHVAASRAD